MADNQKKVFQIPLMEIIKINKADILTTSAPDQLMGTKEAFNLSEEDILDDPMTQNIQNK